MKQFIKNLLFAIIGITGIFGCASETIYTEGSLSRETGTVKATYGWLDRGVPSDDIRVNTPEIQNMVRSSVEKHLAAMGYVRVEPAQADYLLTWFGNIEEEVKELSIASYYNRTGYAGLIGTLPEQMENGKVKKVFSRGTLIIDVLDRESEMVLWRGSATNTLQADMSPSGKAEYIDVSVKNILAKLPRR